MYDDIRDGRGFCFIDPHGQSAHRILDAIPSRRRRDIRYLDPIESPIAFNPMQKTDNNALVASNLMTIFKLIWWPRADYPNTENLLLHAIATLLERPHSTLADLRRLLADKPYRNKIIANLRNDYLLKYWHEDFHNLTPTDEKESHTQHHQQARPVPDLPGSSQDTLHSPETRSCHHSRHQSNSYNQPQQGSHRAQGRTYPRFTARYRPRHSCFQSQHRQSILPIHRRVPELCAGHD